MLSLQPLLKRITWCLAINKKNVLILFFVICYITKKNDFWKRFKGTSFGGVLNWSVVCLEKTERRLGF